jgi:hypothetical protein
MTGYRYIFTSIALEGRNDKAVLAIGPDNSSGALIE